jgi:dihydropteroate synthase
VTEEKELARVIPVIEALVKLVPAIISIDTDKPKVAKKAIECGATLINCIRGFANPEMLALAADSQAELCVMHMQGTPETMQINPSYPNGVVAEILAFFEKEIELLTQAGISPEKIILDPGIGFGLTVEHTIEIFQKLSAFKKFGLRLLIGASRKSFLSKILSKPVTELLPATLAIHTIALCSGADIIRAHDVREHRDIINVLQSVSAAKMLPL